MVGVAFYPVPGSANSTRTGGLCTKTEAGRGDPAISKGGLEDDFQQMFYEFYEFSMNSFILQYLFSDFPVKLVCFQGLCDQTSELHYLAIFIRTNRRQRAYV